MTTSPLTGGGLPANLSDIPGMLPPPGVIPNFDNPYNRGGTFTAVATIITVAMLIFVATKLYTKHFINKKLGWDDLTCFLGALAATAYYIDCLYGNVAKDPVSEQYSINRTPEVKHGKTGIHEWNVQLSYLTSDDFLKTSYLGTVLVPPAMTFTKLTFFLAYLQIFWPFKWLRICVYLGAAVTIMFYLATDIFWLYEMTPRRGKTWASVAYSPAELKTLVLSVPVAAVGLAIDMYLLILPITAVMQLQLPTRRKVEVVLIFLTGIAACVSSALSVYYRTLLDRNADITWNLVSVNILSVAEMSIGLCCVCMPSMFKMLGHHLPQLKAWITSRYPSGKASISNDSVKRLPRMGWNLLRHRTETPDTSRNSYLDIERNTPGRLDTGTSSLPYQEGSMQQSVRTFINSGNKNVTDDDGIHYKVELKQLSRQYNSR
ncbi:hypothetical protein BDR22DRAFT_887254 [Usnea florida]